MKIDVPTVEDATSGFVEGFHLVGPAFDVQFQLPAEVSPGLQLQRPNDRQLQDAMEVLDEVGPHARKTITQMFQTNRSEKKPPVPLPKESWRYLILRFEGNGDGAFRFFETASLLEPAMYSLCHVSSFKSGAKQGWTIDPLLILRQQLEPRPEIDSLDDNFLGVLRSTHIAVTDLKKEIYTGLARAIQLASLFARMPLMGVLDVLAHFMIIEMLLTHNPNDKEVGDSLNHQVQTKVPFLLARAGISLEYPGLDASVAPKKLWSRLYAYRSQVAHGAVVDFSKGDLRILGNVERANTYLAKATRALIRFALSDPDLFEGLKAM